MFERFLVLAAILALPLAAHASAIDDFAITGNGDVITFSLPASPAGNSSPGAGALYFNNIAVTVNGVTTSDSIDVPTSTFSGGVFVPGFLQFMGPQLYGPSILDPTFLTGSFPLYTELLAPPFTETDYSLTITPETTSPTPEPASLILLSSGILALAGHGFCRRRFAG